MLQLQEAVQELQQVRGKAEKQREEAAQALQTVQESLAAEISKRRKAAHGEAIALGR